MGICIRKLADSSLAVLNASVPVDLTKISGDYSGCRQFHLSPTEEEHTLHVFSSSIQYIKLRRARRKQTQTALHMLSVSGVVRLSHVELRYSTPIANTTAFRRQPTVLRHQTHPLPLPSWECDTTRNKKQAGQWARLLSSSLVQIAKKPIMFPWTKPLDL